MAQQTFDEFFEQWQDMTANDRLRKALAMRDYLYVQKMGVSSQSADGVSIQRRLEGLEDYIKSLRMECSYEVLQDGIQIRPSWGLGNL